jgi:ferredoxin
MVKIVHYRAKCIGCNACVEVDKSRWRMSRKDGKCNLVRGTEKKGIYSAVADDDDYKSLMAAAKSCPVRIIKIKKI